MVLKGIILVDYYRDFAAQFIAATRGVDMSDAQERFLEALPRLNMPRILDAGSGSGRDSLAFRLAGHRVEAFDASPEMVDATEVFSGVPTRLMRFEEFEWDHEFEGIWACASLLHVAMADLPLVLDKLAFRLVSDGVIYLSFKLGTGERTKDGRRFTDMTEESLRKVLDLTAGLTQFQVWLSHDRRPDKASEMWLNALVKKA